jgi:hypothetical protein
MKLIILFLSISACLFSGDDFMLHWKAYDFGMAMPILFLFIFIPLWIVASLLLKGKGNSFFKILFYINFAIFIISVIAASASHHIENQKHKPKHRFQKPYEYGIYKNNVVVFEEKNDSIIDMYLNTNLYYANVRNLSYLTQQGMVVCDIGKKISHRYIDASAVKPLMAECHDLSLRLLTNDNNISYYDINSKKFQNKYNEVPTSLNLFEDYIENAHHKKYDRYGSQSYWSDYKKLYLDHIEINDTKHIKKIGYHSFLSVMDKKKNEIIFYKDGYPIHKFQLNKKPKLALYDWIEDIVYVVYEEDDTKIYELNNILASSYKLVQNRVKTILNEVYQPWWSLPKAPYNGISQKEMDKLTHYLKDNAYMHFDYKVKQLKESNISYEVEITSKIKPLKSLVFVLDANKTYTKINAISYNTHYLKKELFKVLAQELMQTKTDFDLLIWLIRYESLLADIEYEYALENHDIQDQIKKRLANQIDNTMRDYFWSEVYRISHSFDKKDAITIFKKKYTCVNKYLIQLRKYRKRYLSLPHPLTDANVVKSLNKFFYILNRQCNKVIAGQSKKYKKLFEEIDRNFPMSDDYELKKILKKLHINSTRFKNKKLKKKKKFLCFQIRCRNEKRSVFREEV